MLLVSILLLRAMMRLIALVDHMTKTVPRAVVLNQVMTN
jgi:hypothetical protein